MENKNDKKRKPIYSRTLDNLISQKRMPMLFIGSGISKRYLENYPTWNELLIRLGAKIGVSETQLLAMAQEITDVKRDASGSEINQSIGEQLTTRLRQQVINGTIKMEDLFTPEDINIIKNRNVPLIKMLVAKEFSTYTFKTQAKYANELAEFRKLQNSIGVVITTNYDRFLEKIIFKNFTVYSDQTQYYMSDSVGIGEIYKIHGSVSAPENIIFSASDYNTFEKNLRGVAAKVLTLSMDYPIIFMGYSLQDENILKILHTLIDCLNENQLATISQNLIYINWKPQENRLYEQKKTITHEGRTLNLTSIETDNYYVIYKYLQKIIPTERPERVRKYKKMIRDLIFQSNAGEKTIVTTEKSLDELKNDNNLVIAFGAKNSFSEKGVVGLGIEDMIKDVLSSSPIEEQYAINIIKEAYIKNGRFAKNHFVPVFYYFNFCSDTKLLNNKKIKDLCANCQITIDKINSNSSIKIMQISELRSNKSKMPPYLLLQCIIKSYVSGAISYNEHIQFLAELNDELGLYTNSDFRKALTIADYTKIKEKTLN